MYRGLAKIVGMRVIPTGMTFDEELDTLEEHFDEHDFFFLHYKPADAAGEDGDFNAKVRALEDLGRLYCSFDGIAAGCARGCGRSLYTRYSRRAQLACGAAAHSFGLDQR